MMGLRDPTSPRFILWLSRARGAIMHPKIIKGRPCVWPREIMAINKLEPLWAWFSHDNDISYLKSLRRKKIRTSVFGLIHGSDNTLPIFTQTLHRSYLNKGCYGMLHTPLKCNLVNFDIPNGFLYYGNPFGISKLTRLHFKGVCNIP